MKKSLVCSLGFIIIGAIFTQCVFEETPELNVPENVSFSGDILPIFDARCNSSSCHGTGGAKPDLTAANAWSSLQSGFINKNNPESSLLVTSMDGGSMAPYSADRDISLIIQWIRKGAQNN